MSSKYSWQLADWRNFSYDKAKLATLEKQFLHSAGIIVGAQKALSDDDREVIKISLLSNEALHTSAIEGELLDRESVQSSLKRYFQLKNPISKNYPRENGIAKMMVDLFLKFDVSFSHQTFFRWHQMLMNGRTDLEAVGKYRVHPEPMRIVSGSLSKPEVHYEAPPSKNIPNEMELFVSWFNASQETLPPLTRAGIAHAYFELIHPFEDGNGRIGRALVEKSLAQSLGQPTLIAFSQTIQANRNDYYKALALVSKSNDFTAWLDYFCKIVLEAQQYTVKSIEFLIAKTRFFDKNVGRLNDRQLKLIQRIFQENLKGFVGGVSVKNYIKITKTSPATANRDLNDLVSKGIMKRTGELKKTRYWLQI